MPNKTRKIAATGMLCALTYVVMAVGRVPVVLFLKYDPSDIVVTLGGLIWGPMTAFTVSAAVAVIEMLTVSHTGLLGCIMNIVQTVSFACTAAAIYRKRRTLGGAVAGLRIDEAGRRALLNGRAAALTPKEYQLLRLLSRAPGAVLTKEEIYQTVWREPANGCLHAVENTVFQLRKKLRPLAAGQDVIETAVGYGYRLAAEVRAGAD